MAFGENSCDQEKQASHEQRKLDTLLQDLNMPICSLVGLAYVEDGADEPKEWAGDQSVQSMFLKQPIVSILRLHLCRTSFQYRF